MATHYEHFHDRVGANAVRRAEQLAALHAAAQNHADAVASTYDEANSVMEPTTTNTDGG